MPFNNVFPARANGTIGPSRFVALDPTGDNFVIQATDGVASHGQRVVGVSQPSQKRTPGLAGSDTTIAAEAGDSIMIRGLGDVPEIEAGAVLAAGDPLKSDANGRAIKATASADIVVGYALQAATALGTKVLMVLESPSTLP